MLLTRRNKRLREVCKAADTEVGMTSTNATGAQPTPPRGRKPTFAQLRVRCSQEETATPALGDDRRGHIT